MYIDYAQEEKPRVLSAGRPVYRGAGARLLSEADVEGI